MAPIFLGPEWGACSFVSLIFRATLRSSQHGNQSIPLGSVWMWELDYKEGWEANNWCFSTVVLKKTLESPLDSKEIKPVSPKGNQSWMFIRRTDAEAEAPVLWPPDTNKWLIGKNPDAGEEWGQEEKRAKEDETVGWYHVHQLKGHEFEQTPVDSEGQGSLACCSLWGHKELDMT